MRRILLRLSLLFAVAAAIAADVPNRTAQSGSQPTISADSNDWAMYTRVVLGTRHNPAEKALSKENVGQLVEKWRFPPADSSEKIGVVQAAAVVNGHVYFGTET